VAARRRRSNVPDQEKSIPEVVVELRELLVSYAKQEIVDPVKSLGRFLLWGGAGSVALGIGGLLLVLAALRALQTETGSTFTGHWSWVPYVITFAASVGVAVLLATRIGAKRKETR